MYTFEDFEKEFIVRCQFCRKRCLRNEMNGSACSECHEKICDDAFDSAHDNYGVG